MKRTKNGKESVAEAPEGGYLRIPSTRARKGFEVNKASMDLLGKVDAAVFDCDGVLIDARRSYDVTIRVVVETMVKEISGSKLTLEKIAPRLIATIRRTGGFNSDWDTTYALTLFSMVALEELKDRGVTRSAVGVVGVVDGLSAITEKFGSAPRERGKQSVDSFLEKEFPSLQDNLDRSREHMGYPATPPEGRMTTLFDELYFGGALFEKMHGLPAINPRKKGLIELEKLLITRETLDSLTKKLGRRRLAIVTGRPYLNTAYSLGEKVMSYFDRESSMFIGDADINTNLRTEYDLYRKPSPEALFRAREKLSSAMMLYVGDSAEDLRMVQKLRKKEGRTDCQFAGVYETSPSATDQIAFFEREGADMVVGSVNQVPSGLLLPQKSEVA